MKVLTFTATSELGKCANCKLKIREGQKVTIQKSPGFVEYFHYECPVAPTTDFNQRVIQGSK